MSRFASPTVPVRMAARAVRRSSGRSGTASIYGWQPVPVTRYRLTAAAVVVALVAAVVQYTVPDVVPALQRDAGALADGQWWRVATPVLVQTLGWYQVVA